MTFIPQAGVSKRLAIHVCLFDLTIFNANIVATLCASLVKIGPVTQKFTLLTIAHFVAMRQHWHIMPNISEYSGHILTYFIGCVGVLVGMVIQIIVWQSPKDVAMATS